MLLNLEARLSRDVKTSGRWSNAKIFIFNVGLEQTRVWCNLEVFCANLKTANSNPILRFHQLLYSFCTNLFRTSNPNKRGGWVNWWSVEPFDAIVQTPGSRTGAVLSCRYFAHNSWLTAWKLLVSNTSELKCVQSQMRQGEVSLLLVRAWVEADPIFPMRPCQLYPLPLLPPSLPPSSSPSSPSSCSTWHLWTPLHWLIMLRNILSSL